MRNPDEPSRAEREEHELTHGTVDGKFASWCAACVKARANADHHRSAPEADSACRLPTVSCDFFYLDMMEEVKKLTAIVLKCSSTKYLFARVCKGKSTRAESYSTEIIRYVVKCMDMLVFRRMIIKSDQEASMEALHERVKEMRVHETISE